MHQDDFGDIPVADPALPPAEIALVPPSELQLAYADGAAPVAEALVPVRVLPPELPAAQEIASEPRVSVWSRMGREVVAGVQTLISAAVYATLIVTFGFQVARVDGLSMAPT